MTKQQHFQNNVRSALASNKSDVWLNAGDPHKIFVQKGLKLLPFRVSPAVIRKARNAKYNDHNVKQADLERLPELLYNPVALFKSLSNPRCFVIVLDAKDEKNRPIVVSVKPENQFNNITSLYGRDNFIDFVERTNNAGAILSVNKEKAIKSNLLPPIQFRSPVTFDDFQELVYQQSQNMSSAKIESKENIMAEIKIEDREEARGFVQGVCESAVIVAQKDKELSRKLLGELGVTKELSKKFAEPETFKALQKDVFAPPKVEREQTLERGRGISR
jgi:hypothetical protein